MDYVLKKNTDTGGFSLHTEFGYAECPHFIPLRPCGTWCALFRIGGDGRSTSLGCGNSIATVFLREALDEETT